MAGLRPSLDLFETALKEKYELTVGGRLGPGLADEKEISVLDGITGWTGGASSNNFTSIRECDQGIDCQFIIHDRGITGDRRLAVRLQACSDRALRGCRH